jgi:hypothetical protein
VHNIETREQFVELRGAGKSYSAIADELNVSKPTLIEWGKDLQREIANAKVLRMDELFETFAVSKAKRIEVFGKRLEAILAELDKRPLTDIPTGVLLKLALDYGDRMKTEAEPLEYIGNDIKAIDQLLKDMDGGKPEVWSI